MGRKIRALSTMLYSIKEKNIVQKNKKLNAERAEFITQKDHNTVTIIRENNNNVLAHAVK